MGRNIAQAFVNIWETLTNWKYLLFLVIMSLFWTAFNQLYYSFPVFVDQWTDTGMIYRGIRSVLPGLASAIGTPEGTISAVTISAMDSFFIIVFQLVVSAFVMRYRPLSAMMGGILVLAGGLALMFSPQSGWLVLLGVLVFGLGEMASSPKFTEYVGQIAPDDRKALYMGTSFLPIAAGHQLAGWLSGDIFEHISDKYYLLAREAASKNISLPSISDSFSKNEYWEEAARQMGMTPSDLQNYLWQQYHPGQIWYLFAGIALSAAIFLWLYDRFIVGRE